MKSFYPALAEATDPRSSIDTVRVLIDHLLSAEATWTNRKGEIALLERHDVLVWLPTTPRSVRFRKPGCGLLPSTQQAGHQPHDSHGLMASHQSRGQRAESVTFPFPFP